MSKQESTNTFSDGLNMDLNPINTPSSILTDCLNGTFITYNGNEYILQNDQGNYKLIHCKLRENFIPVGIKEYADILYIVSYNPITKETEIGSYPSPGRIVDTDDERSVVEFIKIIDFSQYSETDVTLNYSDISDNSPLQVYAISDKMENYKLNPGDEFALQITSEDNDFQFQELKFSILDDNKEIFPIEIPDEYKITNPPLSSDYKYVFWENPGWLSGKYELANLDIFNVNIKSFKVDNYALEGNFNITDLWLNLQLETNDSLFLNSNNEEWILNPPDNNGLGVEISVYYTEGDFDENQQPVFTQTSFDLTKINYSDVLTMFYQDTELNRIYDQTFNSNMKVMIKATPLLRTNFTNNQNQSSILTIYYDQFITWLEIDLSNIGNIEDVSVAQNVFKHIVTDDSITITYDINTPLVTNNNIELYYDIYDYTSYNSSVLTPIISSVPITDYNLDGNSMLTIEFNSDFRKEDMYVIAFRIYIGEQDINGTIKPVYSCFPKLLITSETFNEFYQNINEFNSGITIDQWVPNYSKFTILENLLFYETNGYPTYTPIVNTSDDLNNPVYGEIPSQWVTESSWNRNNNPRWEFGQIIKDEYNLSYNISNKLHDGRLWMTFDNDLNLFNSKFDSQNSILSVSLPNTTINTPIQLSTDNNPIKIYDTYTIDYTDDDFPTNLGTVTYFWDRLFNAKSDQRTRLVYFSDIQGNKREFREYDLKDGISDLINNYNNPPFIYYTDQDLIKSKILSGYFGVPIMLCVLKNDGNGGDIYSYTVDPGTNTSYLGHFNDWDICTAILMPFIYNVNGVTNTDICSVSLVSNTNLNRSTTYPILEQAIDQFCKRVFWLTNFHTKTKFQIIPMQYSYINSHRTTNSETLKIINQRINLGYCPSGNLNDGYIRYSQNALQIKSQISTIINRVCSQDDIILYPTNITSNIKNFDNYYLLSYKYVFEYNLPSISYSFDSIENIINQNISLLESLRLDQVTESNELRQKYHRLSTKIEKNGIYRDFDDNMSEALQYDSFLGWFATGEQYPLKDSGLRLKQSLADNFYNGVNVEYGRYSRRDDASGDIRYRWIDSVNGSNFTVNPIRFPDYSDNLENIDPFITLE